MIEGVNVLGQRKVKTKDMERECRLHFRSMTEEENYKDVKWTCVWQWLACVSVF